MRSRWKKRMAGFMLLVMMLTFLPTNVVQAATYKKGSKGTNVQYLQQNLAFLGCSPGSADGSYGAKTEKAVKALQKMLHMKETGIVDEELDALIKGTVCDVQIYLQKKGYYSGELDGIKGSMMAAGYKKLQKELGYKQNGVFDLEVAKVILQDNICAGTLKSLQEFMKRTGTIIGSTGKGITFKKSVKLAELTNLANELYEYERYKKADALPGTETNITIKSVGASIESLVELLNLVDAENVEVNTFVAGYNDDKEELAKLESFFVSLEDYLILQKESLTEYRDVLCAAPYWMRYLNVSNMVDVTNDCDKVISCIDNVINEDIYTVQMENGKKVAAQVAESEAKNVVEVAEKDFNNAPRYIPNGTPYNGIKKERQWCVDYVQYILEHAGKKHFDNGLCGTVDQFAMCVSKYGGTLYVTCSSDYKYYDSSARISLQSDIHYKNKICMDFKYDSTMEVRPGDFIIYGCAPELRFAHVGLCIEVYEDGSFKTIEGNTSWKNYSSQCLNEKNRSLDWSAKNNTTGEVSYIMGVLRPDYSGKITASDVE